MVRKLGECGDMKLEQDGRTRQNCVNPEKIPEDYANFFKAEK